MVLYCIFKSTPPFALLLDDIEHANRHHPYEGYQCFRCVLKELFLASWKARDDKEMIDLFAEICSSWDFNDGNFDGLVPFLLSALESWITDNDGSDCEDQFHKLFRFDTHVKWGCHHCKQHFSNTLSQFIFEVQNRTLHLYLDQLTSEIWRICKECKICTAYDRVGLGRLPRTLVFADAAHPLLQLKVGEVLYQIRVVIPDLVWPVVYVCCDGGWMQIDMQKRNGQSTGPPATTGDPSAFASTQSMAYVFYSRV